jgi:formiminoglutamase
VSAPWLTVERATRRCSSVPLPASRFTGLRTGLVSIELARHDTDWFVDQLYGFVADLGATVVHTAPSRSDRRQSRSLRRFLSSADDHRPGADRNV